MHNWKSDFDRWIIMNGIKLEEIVYWLGGGAIALLTTFAWFSVCDLYRRLRKVEELREEMNNRLIAMETNLVGINKGMDDLLHEFRSSIPRACRIN